MKNVFTLFFLLLLFPFLAQAQAPGISPQNAEGCIPFTVQFQQLNISNPSEWTWYFQGADIAQSTETSPTVVFVEEGLHTVLLESNAGDSITVTVNALTATPQIIYSLLDSSSAWGTQLQDSNASYLWEFDDGQTFNSGTVVRDMPDYDPHTVSLTVTNQCGTGTTTIETISFYADVTEGCAPLTTTFTQVNPKPSEEWEWFIGSTDSINYLATNPTVVFQGDYNPQIKLINKYGSSVYRTNYIHVGSAANISFSTQINGSQVQFLGQANEGSFIWDFGDGTTSTQQSPIHNYNAIGDYTVTFTNSGLCGIVTKTQTIHINSLTAYIEAIDTTIDAFVKNMVVGNKQGVFNVAGSYHPISLGTFNNFATTALELDKGIILSTGNIFHAIGPNDVPGKSTVLGLPGIDYNTYDATTLEFDFIPSTNVIDFSYVFASEEYPEYVNSGFNDIFEFNISGPGVAFENIALIPNTDQQVSINTVNGLTNSTYYKSNVDTNYVDLLNIQYDGFTVPLIASKALTPFETYHIKFIIMDVGDAYYDSAVFLKANSFQSKPLVFDFDFTEGNYEQTIYEDSLLLEISATLPAVAQADITYHFSYAGDAEMGVDYIAPEIFTFQAGDTTAIFKIKALADDIVESDEKIVLVIDETQDTLTVTIKDQTALGNQHLTANNIQLTPNPTKDVFSIPNSIQASLVEIYALSGKRVKTFKNGFEKMDIADLPKGIYSVRVVTQEDILVGKLKVE